MAEYKYPPEGAQAGTVIGPGSSTDNAVARFNGTTGESIQNSGVIIDDSNNMTGVAGITSSGAIITSGEITALDGTTGEIPLGVSAGRAATTGLLTGGGLSIDADPTKFDVAAGSGVIVDKWTNPLSPVYTFVSWNAFNAQTVTNLATQNNTSIGINSSGAIVQFTVSDYDTAKRDYIMLGTLIHASRVQIDSVNDSGTNSGYDIGETVLDLALAVGSINLTGNVYGPNGTNLNINKSEGTAFSVGVNIKTSKKYPNTVTSPSQTAPTFFYTYRNGSGGYAVTTTTTINPNQYDTGTGTLVTVSNNKWTIQRIYAAANFTVVEYGQNQYDTEADALSAIRTEAHTSNPDLATLLLRSYLVVKKGATALNDTAQAEFIEASRFGGGTSNSATTSTTNLQQSYNNSSNPEILTDSTRGAVTIRRGSAADSDNVLEIQANAGTNTFTVTGSGNVAISGNTTFAGTVDLTTTKIAEGTNLYFTDERAQDAVGLILTDTNDIELSYVDGTPSISADLRSSSITAKTEVTADVADFVMISDTSDSGNLKKADLGDFLLTTATQTATNKTLDNPIIDNAATFVQESTPSAPASGRNKIYPKSDDRWYSLNSAGVEQPLGSGSGSGGVTLIANPSDAGGWSETGTVFATPVTTSTSGDLPLSGATSTAIQFVATGNGAEASHYNSYSVTTSAAMNGKLQVDFFMRPGTGFAASEWTVSVYQDSTRQSLSSDSSGVTYLPNTTGRFTVCFDAVASTAYTLRFARVSGTGSATLNVCNVFLGWPFVSQTAPVGGPTTWTPTGSWVSNVTYTGTYVRTGTRMRANVLISITGAVTATSLTVNLPSGLTIDSSVVGIAQYKFNYGKGTGYQSPTASNLVVLSNGSTSAVALGYQSATSGVISLVSNSAPATWANGNSVSFWFEVPIAEWAGSVSTGPVPAEEFASSTSGTWDAAATAAQTVYSPRGSIISGNLSALRTKTVRFTYPIQQDDELILEIDPAGNGIWVPAVGSNIAGTANIATLPLTATGASFTSGASVGVGWSRSSTTATDVDVFFGTNRASTLGDTTSGWSDFTNGYWRLRKTKKASLPYAKADSSASGLVAPRKGQYSLTVTGSVALTGYRAVGIYYQDQDGNHRLKFNISSTVASGSRGGNTLTITGITFKNSGFSQAVSGYTDAAATYASATSNSNTIPVVHGTATTTVYSVSGDVELESKPTWA